MRPLSLAAVRKEMLRQMDRGYVGNRKGAVSRSASAETTELLRERDFGIVPPHGIDDSSCRWPPGD